MLLIYLLRRSQMSFYLNITRKVPDKQYTYHCIKTWKAMYIMQVFKGTTFCYIMLHKVWLKKMLKYLLFLHQRCFLSDVIYFTWKRSECSINCITYSEKSLFYQTHVSSDKRQSHTGYAFSSCWLKIDRKSCMIISYFWKCEH